jgi:hypothetical protein
VSVLLLALATLFGVIRHDRPDSLYQQLGNAPQFAAVGRVVQKNAARGLGSGTLVAPRWFITAAHVVCTRERTCSAPDSLQIQFGSDTVAVTHIVMHPGYSDPSVSSTADPQARKGEDVALVELAVPPRGIAPARLGAGVPVRGEIAYFVGYGASGDAFSFLKSADLRGLKRAGTNTIDSLGASFRDRRVPEWDMVADFDGMGFPEASLFGSTEPTDLEILPAGGDSGGGVFVQYRGEWYLAGVFHSTIFFDDAPLARGVYGTAIIAVHIDHIAHWVAQTTAAH